MPSGEQVTGKATILVSEKDALPLPVDEWRWLHQADALVASGRVEEAVAQLRTLVHALPDSTRGYLRLADLLRQRRRAGEAREILETAVAHVPDCPVSREALADVCVEIGRYDDAIPHGQALLALKPRSIHARDILSTAFLHRGQYERALRLTDEMVRLDPYDPGHHFKRGVILQQAGLLAASCRAFTRTLELAPDDELQEACQMAIDLLERYQIRQVLSLASEDILFHLHLLRDAQESARARGFCLSETAVAVLAAQLPYLTLDSQPGWRHYRYH
ncbi:tetratricopeptide repeat protein [Armatimonas sp.]|uniref:tetratricopeptide repeat protein n=1 Tax=Armatimonas sp. TaxID=1872638 RepID=UPI003751B4E9